MHCLRGLKNNPFRAWCTTPNNLWWRWFLHFSTFPFAGTLYRNWKDKQHPTPFLYQLKPLLQLHLLRSILCCSTNHQLTHQHWLFCLPDVLRSEIKPLTNLNSLTSLAALDNSLINSSPAAFSSTLICKAQRFLVIGLGRLRTLKVFLQPSVHGQ